ncbi:MAG: hypothetical protein LC749_12605 [Actinobacteria bacterium]|nr:hypothetical protein [Actinomycetota bacterium]
MRGNLIGGILAAIGVIYAAGFVIHYWGLFAAITLIIIGLKLHEGTTPVARPATPARVNTSQAAYSNRR